MVVGVVLIGDRDRFGPDLGRRCDRLGFTLGHCLDDSAARCVAARDVGGGLALEVEVEVAVDLTRMIAGPLLQSCTRQPRRHSDAVVVQLGRCGQDADRADDGEADRDDGEHDGETCRYAGEVERQSRPSGDDEVAEHAFRQIDGAGGAAHGGSNDEAEDVHDPGDEGSEDVVAAGRTVGRGVDCVGHETDREEDDRDPDVDRDQGDHETASLAQLHESGGDHPTGREPGPPVVGGASVGRRQVGCRRLHQADGRHDVSPNLLVTSRNHDSREAWTCWSR